MAERIQQVRRTADGDEVVKTTRVVDDDLPVAAETDRDTTATRVIWFIAGVLLALLAFRFVLILLGANPSNSFAHFIYTVSYPFAAPFFGLFGYNLQYGVSRFELSTLVAMLVYTLIAFGLTRLVTITRPRSRV